MGAGSSQGSGGGDDDLIAGINVTPLVDVVLVLLVIFLITAPVLYQSAIKVQLPKASNAEQNSSQNSALQFSVTKDGTVSWNNQIVSWEELEKRLHDLDPQGTPNAEGAQSAQSAQSAMISADQATPHGTVIKLMDILRKYGLTRFALNVDNAR